MSRPKEVRFAPFNMLIALGGFIVGFFLTDVLIPIFEAISGFLSGGGQFPTQSLFGPVSNMSGPMSMIIIAIIALLILALAKKFTAFLSWLCIGILGHGVALALGFQIPSLLDLFSSFLPI